MSHFYSVISGQAGAATRCGSKSSGIMAVVASWRGSIRVDLHVDEHGVDRFTVSQEPWHGAGVSYVISRGVVGVRPDPNKE